MQKLWFFLIERWRYFAAAVLLVAVVAAVALFAFDWRGWATYRAEGEVPFSVRYLKTLEVYPDYLAPLFVQGELLPGVRFSFPKEVLQGSRVSGADFTVVPLKGGVCEPQAILTTGTTTRAKKDGRVTYKMTSATTVEREFLDELYVLPGEPCVSVLYHFTFTPNNGYDPNEPPSMAQSRSMHPGEGPKQGAVQFADVRTAFDAMRGSLHVAR